MKKISISLSALVILVVSIFFVSNYSKSSLVSPALALNSNCNPPNSCLPAPGGTAYFGVSTNSVQSGETFNIQYSTSVGGTCTITGSPQGGYFANLSGVGSVNTSLTYISNNPSMNNQIYHMSCNNMSVGSPDQTVVVNGSNSNPTPDPGPNSNPPEPGPTCNGDATLSGWAWSSNIGWLNFNSSDTNAGGGPYSVLISTTTGALSGYAWSPNIGWVSFNPSDVSGCPTGTCSPTVNMTTGAVTGWARAIAGVGRTDGWDGWIHLSDDSHHISPNLGGTGGVTLNMSSKNFLGYAWGDTNVGWLQFNPPYGGVSYNECGSTPQPQSDIVLTCSVNPTTLGSNGGTLTYATKITGGIGPYVYTYIPTSIYPTNNVEQNNTTDSKTISGPTITVLDDNGKSGNTTCPSVNQSGANNSQGPDPANTIPSNINLYIDTTGTKAAANNFETLSIIKGNYFGLAWDPPSLSNLCVVNVSEPSILTTDIDQSWIPAIRSVIHTQNKLISGLSTANVDSNQYYFQIKCNNNDSNNPISVSSNIATLKVNDSGETQR